MINCLESQGIRAKEGKAGSLGNIVSASKQRRNKAKNTFVQYTIKSFVQPLILDNLLRTGNTDFSEQNHKGMYILEEKTPVVPGWVPGKDGSVQNTEAPCSHNPYISHGEGAAVRVNMEI